MPRALHDGPHQQVLDIGQQFRHSQDPSMRPI